MIVCCFVRNILILSFCLCLVYSHSHRAETPLKQNELNRERESDGAFSPRDKNHYVDGEHHSEFDHEAILGSKDAAEEFDTLSPEEAKKRLQVIVEKMDKNKDNFVDHDELTNWVMHSFRLLSQEESEERLDDSDANEDGYVTWQEYIAETYAISSSNEIDREEFDDEYKMLVEDEELFRAADKNRDGKLSKSEFLTFTHPEDFEEMQPIIYQRQLKEKDTDQDGYISFQEFIGSEGKHHEKEWLIVEKDRFDHEFDKDHDGKLNMEELLLWLVPNNKETAQQEADHLIETADDNRDHILSMKEILDHHDVFVGSEVTDFGHHLHNTHKFDDEL